MQKFPIYVVAAQTLGVVRNSANSSGEYPPTLTLGVACELDLRLFAQADSVVPYDTSVIHSVTSWSWSMDSDFAASTTVKLRGDNANIQVVDVQTSGGETYADIHIPMTEMNTQEAAQYLGNNETAPLNGELVGYDSLGAEVFVLQLKGFMLRNRIEAAGEPTNVESNYLNAEQVRALVAAGFAVQFSADGTSWHDSQGATDRFFRFRSASTPSAQWSPVIGIASGGGSSPDLSGYYNADEVDALLDDKQDALPSGTAGKYLKKTADGVEWADAPQGVGSADMLLCGTAEEMADACNANNIGKVCLYTGDSTSTYTKGHHYAVKEGAAALTAESTDTRAAGTYTPNGNTHTYNGVSFPDYENESGTVLLHDGSASKLKATTAWDPSKSTGDTVSNSSQQVTSLDQWPGALATGSAVTFAVYNVSLYTLDVTFSYAAGGAEFEDLDAVETSVTVGSDSSQSSLAISLVSALPSAPDTNTIYFVMEGNA